jgi:hypothetical protein
MNEQTKLKKNRSNSVEVPRLKVVIERLPEPKLSISPFLLIVGF